MTGPETADAPGISFVLETIGPLPTGAPYDGVNPLLEPIKFFIAPISDTPPDAAIFAKFAVFKPVCPSPVPSRPLNPGI
jgi:hypothetical protein